MLAFATVYLLKSRSQIEFNQTFMHANYVKHSKSNRLLGLIEAKQLIKLRECVCAPLILKVCTFLLPTRTVVGRPTPHRFVLGQMHNGLTKS